MTGYGMTGYGMTGYGGVGGARPRPDPEGERPGPHLRREVRDLTAQGAPHHTRALCGGHPPGEAAGGPGPLQAVVRRGERRQVSGPACSMARHHDLPGRQHDREHRAQRRRGERRPHRRRPTVARHT